MKILLSGISLFLMLIACKAQTQQTDTIFFFHSGAPTFSYNNKSLPPRHLFYLLRKDPATEPYLNYAKSNHRASSIFGFAGGYLIGWNLGKFASGNEHSTAGFIVGSGLIVLSLPFYFNYIKNAKSAAAIYNSNKLQPKTSQRNLSFSTSFNEYGATLKVQF
jgi:hypothetical protein